MGLEYMPIYYLENLIESYSAPPKVMLLYLGSIICIYVSTEHVWGFCIYLHGENEQPKFKDMIYNELT